MPLSRKITKIQVMVGTALFWFEGRVLLCVPDLWSPCLSLSSQECWGWQLYATMLRICSFALCSLTYNSSGLGGICTSLLTVHLLPLQPCCRIGVWFSNSRFSKCAKDSSKKISDNYIKFKGRTQGVIVWPHFHKCILALLKVLRFYYM